jgi:hypothetical protein
VDGGDRPAQGVVAAPGQQVNLQLHQIGQLDQQLGADLRSHVGEGLVDEGPHARGGLGVGGIAQNLGGRLHCHAAGPPVGAPGWIWAQWGQRDAGDGAPVQLAGPGRGATEPLADLPEGTAGAAVQAIAKPGHQPLPGGVQALHGGGEGIGEHRRERPGVVDPLLGDPGSDRHAEGLEAG